MATEEKQITLDRVKEHLEQHSIRGVLIHEDVRHLYEFALDLKKQIETLHQTNERLHATNKEQGEETQQLKKNQFDLIAENVNLKRENEILRGCLGRCSA